MSRRTPLIVGIVVVTATLGALVADPPPHIIWNASASVPIGLYAVHPTGKPVVGKLVIVTPPEPLATFLSNSGYLPRDVPLLKHIAGLPGQQACRIGRRVMVDGAVVATARWRDRRGSVLPVWNGCRRIAQSEVFLLNAHAPDSLDGRYFGPLPARSITGRASPIWTDPNGNGRFVWHGFAP